MNIFEKDKEFVANTYARFPVQLVSGKGSVVVDEKGKEYIDLGSGIGVTAFGIADEEWAKSVSDQLLKLQHASNLYYTSPCAELAELICTSTGMKKVFFGNSGAEANECAIKIARKYAAMKKGSDCFNIITLENSFHGRTLATLAATGQEVFHRDFLPLTEGFIHTPANDCAALERLVNENRVAGIMLECIQGEGGVNPLTKEFLQFARRLCDERDILLIIDEVQTGNGRTGELYAFMNFGIKPDLFTTAKGLGGGLPIGAAVMGEKCESVLGYGDHGSTYGGNPVACAGALNVLSRLNNELLDEVKEKSRMVFEALSGAEGIESVCGMGLMIGIKTAKPAKEVLYACLEKGVLCLTAKDKLRLLPALNIPAELLIKALNIIKDACRP